MIVAALIVGPDESLRWLDRTLRRTARWADELLVCCDRDTDTDTLDAVGQWATRVKVSEHAFAEHEGDLRNNLFEMLDETTPDGALVVVIDADEDLVARRMGNPKRALRALDEAGGGVGWWQVSFVHAWTPDASLARTDGGWAPGVQARIYRQRTGQRLANSRPLACGAIPNQAGVPGEPLPELAFLHLGYARADDRLSKHARYATLDGGRYHSVWHLNSIIDAEPTLVRTSTCLP